MTKKEKNNLAIFEDFKIRRQYDKKKESWYFSVIDIVSVLVEQDDFRKAKSYWTTLKGRLKKEGSELVTKCDQLKMQSTDGKFYKTDVADEAFIFTLRVTGGRMKVMCAFTLLRSPSSLSLRRGKHAT